MNLSTMFLSDVLPVEVKFLNSKGRYSFPMGTDCKMVRQSEERIMIYFDKKDVVKYQPWSGSIYLLSSNPIGKFIDKNKDAEQFAAIENYLNTTR